MNGMLSIVQSITATNTNNCASTKLIASLDEHQSFQLKANHELDPIVSHITALLNDHATKATGLSLLSVFLPQCPLDVFEQKGSLWITLCTKVAAQRKPIDAVSISYDVLAQLLAKAIHVPELTKAINSNLLAKIMETTLNLPTDLRSAQLAALHCLESAMRHYSGAAGIGKATTEKFILSFVDSVDDALVAASGRCLLLLQQTRGGGAQSAAHKLAWSQLQSFALGTLNELLDGCFANTSEFVDTLQGTSDRLPLVPLQLSDEPVLRATQLTTRFQNVCKYLQISLLGQFPVSKAVAPAKILSLISRGLAVNCATLTTNLITDNIVMGALLPAIHAALFRLLDSVILVLRRNMLMYGRNVCQLVVQSLKWTSSGRAKGAKRPFSSIRQAAYRTMVLWCQTAGAASGVDAIADDLIPQLLQDIEPFQSEVRLKVLAGGKKHLSKKARKTLQKAQNDVTNMAQTHSKAFNPHNTKVICTDEGNEQLCSEALKCLIATLMANGYALKPVMHKLLQETIVALAVRTIESPSLKSNLYASVDCRIHLYGALHALIISANHLCPPPLQYAAVIFNLVQVRDSNALVREAGTTFLRSIEKILHPQKDNLYFTATLEDVREALKIGQANISINEDDDEDDEEDEEIHLNGDHQKKDEDIVGGNATEVQSNEDRQKSGEEIVGNATASEQLSGFVSDLIVSETDMDDELNTSIEIPNTDEPIDVDRLQPPARPVSIASGHSDQMESLQVLDDSSDDDSHDATAAVVASASEVVDITGDTPRLQAKKRKSSGSKNDSIVISDDEGGSNPVVIVDDQDPINAKRPKATVETTGTEDDMVNEFVAAFSDEINQNLH